MTKPNCEAIAVENLLQQGYGCYFPRFKALDRTNSVVKKPLFPRYIFALIDTIWYSIRGTRGVSHLLMGDKGPAVVPARVIEAIKAKEDPEGFIILGNKPLVEKFAKGEHVKAMEGPLAGVELIYQGMKAHERVSVLASLLGREVQVTIEEKLLVAV